MTPIDSIGSMVERIGILITPHQDKDRGFCWSIRGLRDWSDPEPTKEVALEKALIWLVQQAKLLDAVERIAHNSSPSVSTTWIRFIHYAERTTYERNG